MKAPLNQPSQEAITNTLLSLTIEPLALPADDRITTVIDTLNSKYANGGFIFKQFKISGDASFDCLLEYNRLYKTDFINHIVGSKAFQTALPQLVDIKRVRVLERSWYNQDLFNLPGDIAKHIFYGGAYSGRHFSAEHSYTMATAFVKAFTGHRFSDFTCWHTETGWSGWFHNIAWDSSVFIFDSINKILTVLCLTDSD